MLLLCIFLAFLAVSNAASCPNGCSSRGLCINGVCKCAEGLVGPDCSQASPTIPSPYACPSCYDIVVGPAMYYYGPSWTLPDGPIVGLNNQGNLSVYQGNGNAKLLAQGEDIEDWEITPLTPLLAGPDFDVCGAWLMRAFADGAKVRAFYHAERFCDYGNNGQTRKSAGYAESTDGAFTFYKPSYPANMILDTNTSELVGRPSGEGDYGVVLRDNYYYMFFSNVEDDSIGVARANRSSGGVPGSWFKYYRGAWNQTGLGGKSTPLTSITGTQAYLHTPSNSFLAVGNRDGYFQTGTSFSSSDNGYDWAFVADPLIGGDFATNKDTILYQSILGKTGGVDAGSQFDLFYMWVPPEESWSKRYQIRRSVTLTYNGNRSSSSNTPSTRLALTSYTHRATGERWESVELAIYPYMPTKIVGYLLTRPYPNTFPAYECYSYTTLDHFIGTADDCFRTNVEALRVAGHMWSYRVAKSVAVYRCAATDDTFLSTRADCEGLADAQTKPFGYIMQGPEISPEVLSRDILVGQGQKWNYVFGLAPAQQGSASWSSVAFDDSRWMRGLAPFGSGYSIDIIQTPFLAFNYYFRTTFTIPRNKTLERIVASVASDDYASIYVNGVLIDSDVTNHHEATYWNRQVRVPLNLINVTGTNVIAVLTRNYDTWALFDLQLSARYTEAPVPTAALVCSADCGIKGQCINGACVCDNGWTGAGCATSLCSFSGSTNVTTISRGSSWRHTQWSWVPSTPGNWFVPSYPDSWWHLDSAPFGTSNYDFDTLIPAIRHLFRKTFLVDVPYNQVIQEGKISIASAANHRIWLNGVFLGAPLYPDEYHTPRRWNDVIVVDGSLFTESSNIIAVEINPSDSSYFDLQLQLTFATRTCVRPSNGTSTTTTSVAGTTTAAAAATSTAAAAAATSTAAAAAATSTAAATSAAATSTAAASTAAATSTAAAAAASTSAAAAATSTAAATAAATSSAATSTAAAATAAATSTAAAAATSTAAAAAATSTAAAATTTAKATTTTAAATTKVATTAPTTAATTAATTKVATTAATTAAATTATTAATTATTAATTAATATTTAATTAATTKVASSTGAASTTAASTASATTTGVSTNSTGTPINATSTGLSSNASSTTGKPINGTVTTGKPVNATSTSFTTVAPSTTSTTNNKDDDSGDELHAGSNASTLSTSSAIIVAMFVVLWVLC